MKILITGICGFVGNTLARAFLEAVPGVTLLGVDNFVRPGSEVNRGELARLGVKVHHGDLRNASDFETLPACDWVIDAAANPSVLAGVDGKTSSRQVLEHNFFGTINVLEYCRSHRAGFILLSTSRVYSIKPLAELPVEVHAGAFRPDTRVLLPPGLSAAGVSEGFSTTPPVSLYGSTKIASEAVALEYGDSFRFPVWINRCGVLAGAGQFGKPDQGIFSYWINAHLRRRPLKFIGFSGHGHQVRDALHPRDLVPVLLRQMETPGDAKQRVQNLGGGASNSMSLANLHAWCDDRFGRHKVAGDNSPRPFDIPWMVLDSALAGRQWKWQPATPLHEILDEIAKHAERNPQWLELSEA